MASRMNRASACALLVALAAAGCSSSAAKAPKGSHDTTIAGHKAVEQGSGATAVVLIHGASTHKDSFFSLMPVLAAAGDRAIAYDYDSSGSADVDLVVKAARAQGATRVVLVGSSLGAQHALESADGLHVDAVVTFSSEVEHTIKEPLLAIASKGDGDTATFARHNADAAGGPSKAVIVKGSTHGIDLVHPHPEVMKTVTDWLASVLKGSGRD